MRRDFAALRSGFKDCTNTAWLGPSTTCRPIGRFSLTVVVYGTLRVGEAADLCLFDPERAWQINVGALPGKAQNTPFDGRAVEGRVVGTWKAGVRVFG